MNLCDRQTSQIMTYRDSGTTSTFRPWILPTSCRGLIQPSLCEVETTSRNRSRRDRVKRMISSKGSSFSVLKTGRDPSLEKVSEDSGYHSDDQGGAWHASYRNVLQGDCSPALARELCKAKVFCVYDSALGGEPWYQLVHHRG